LSGVGESISKEHFY